MMVIGLEPEEMIDDDIERLWERDDLCSSDDALFIGTEFVPVVLKVCHLKMENILLNLKLLMCLMAYINLSMVSIIVDSDCQSDAFIS